ncbi:ChaN family lipoprotein [Marinobacter changyiensis]|uniref:ChaN family lipoprotein n=1 Tax=Marinobacter changyiensis TaxID=2604091 RepID=UPI001FE2E54D|nr:ChaN family lipoprotein [Marinobacter changyiensis]
MIHPLKFLSLAGLGMLTGCAMTADNLPSEQSQVMLATLYDSHVVDAATTKAMSLTELVNSLENADVVFFGEYHGHQGAHLLQSQLQVALHRQQPRQVLSMEQFSVDHQATLNRYLSGELGETELIEDADAWPNYRASYRPLVEYAKSRALPVVAANAPAEIARCVGRTGASYLDNLDPVSRSLLPDQPFQEVSAYRAKFLQAMAHGADHSDRMENQYQAQLLRDNTMAVSILDALNRHPGHQVLHINGTFHSEQSLGTVAALRARAPDLEVRVISPVLRDDATTPLSERELTLGDIVYLVLPLPAEYRDTGRQLESLSKQFNNARAQSCGSES